MAERRPDDEDEDLETRAEPGAGAGGGDTVGDAESVGPGGRRAEPPEPEAPTAETGVTGGLGDDDMVSVPRATPGRRPPGALPPGASRPSGASRPPGASLPPGASRPPRGPAPEPEDFEPLTAETNPDAAAGDPDALPTVVESGPSEMPTIDVDVGRAEATAHQDAAGTRAEGGAADDEQATIAESGSDERRGATPSGRTPVRGSGTEALPGAASATPRMPGPVHPSKFSRGTARDVVAGTAAARGTVPGAPGAPTLLKEGELLAERYELVKRLGKGGMGEVWQARHVLLQGMRAIKVIKASISRDRSFRARFLSEGQTMMRVKHPGVVEVTDLDETRLNRELFMVMEYLEGRTMHAAIRDEAAPLGSDVRNAVRIFRELAEGMQRIHDERIVHKDLKTDNVILVPGEDGLDHPKVIDFGLAKRMEDKDLPPEQGAALADPGQDLDTRTTLSGTLAYMAPEQFRGEPSSFRSDVYAFGIMLYECFNRGEYPMPRGSLGDYIRRHKDGEPPRRLRQARPDLDPEIAELADRCMAPAREARPESFREVGDALQWWLDAPKRRQFRNRVLLAVGAAVFLVGIAVYGFLSAEKTAALSNGRLHAGTAQLDPVRGRTWLPPAALADLRFEAVVDGEVKSPSLEVDGIGRPARFDTKDGRLVASFDLSGLADGPHDLAFRASPRAAATKATVVVDRQPPQVTDVRLAEGTEDGWTSSQNPELVVVVGDPHDVLLSVAGARGSERFEAVPDEGDPRRWRIRGTARGDGETVVEVVAVDHAGNRSAPREFRYRRDTVAPALDPAELVRGRFQVRTAAGNRLRVASKEPVRLVAAFSRTGGAAVSTRTFDAPAEAFHVDVPEVPGEGLTVELAARDRAGNESKVSLPVALVPDVVKVLAKDGTDSLSVKGDRETTLDVRRSYPLGTSFRVARSRVRDAAGNPVSEAPVDVGDARVVPSPTDPLAAEVVLPAGFAEGEYRLSVRGLDDAFAPPLALVVDRTRPRIEGIAVRDAAGTEIPTGAWCRTKEFRVEATVADLSPSEILFGGARGDPQPQPGRATYVFRVQAKEQGLVTYALSAKDVAGNSEETSLPVQCDWEDPVLSLDGPREGEALDDVTATTFAGRVSEAPYTLVVEGVPKELRAEHSQAAFATPWLLPEGRHAVVVTAVDRAGRRSAPVALSLSVVHRATDLPDVVDSKQGVVSRMQKVLPGEVVLGGRTQPVPLVFLDRTEVTNAQYRAFLAACAEHRGRTPWDHPDQPEDWSHVPPKETWEDPKWNADEFPVVNVAWWDAYAFAAWTGRRLPTEAEWFKAASKSRDPAELEPRSWPPLPYGSPWKEGMLATVEMTGGKGPVSACESADESPAGMLHMGGNVSEWVDLPSAAKGQRTGVRGGNYFMSKHAADVRSVPTKRYPPDFRATTIGFRCAWPGDAVKL